MGLLRVANPRALAITLAFAFVIDAALIVTGACVQVTIASSQEKSALLADIARDYNATSPRQGARCVRLSVNRVASGDAEEALARGWDASIDGEPPTVWSPAARSWPTLLKQHRAARGESDILPLTASLSLVQSPHVIGMPEPMARALGWPNKPLGYSDILALARDPAGWGSLGRPEWEQFRLGKTNPKISTSGLHALVGTYFAATNVDRALTESDLTNPATVSYVRDVESAVLHYGDSVSTFLVNLYEADRRGGALTHVSAIAVEEKHIHDYNRGDPLSTGIRGVSPIVPLRAIYPKEGTLYADHPYVVLRAPWVDDAQRDAANAFLSYLLTPSVQSRFEAAGFRDHDGTPGSEITDANGLDPSEPHRTLTLPDASILERMQRSWNDLRKRAHLILAIDVSRPMGEPITPGGETKLALAKEAATAGLEKLEVDDDVGIWVFGDGASPRYRELAPIAPLASRREQLAALIAGLAPSKDGTPLYSTIRASVRDLGEHFDRKRINAVVLLTTGRDGDPRDTDLQVLLRDLRSQSDERFVRVFAMTYGASADADTMQLIGKASRGAVYPATDPKTIGRVITNILSNF